ncbi:hypothetical protein [Phaffia rhodozyma]|uniref:Uncharacterized protein n=1 Tax=Phaffia rhodozyma TaxID=264483 RepID=A0A0F7SLZ8_PHARH|nr:hypothetical protein [Phaffia rhodozyma]
MSSLFLVSLLAAGTATAHVALWDPGMYGFNGSNNAVANYDNRDPSQPLRLDHALITSEWFGHGFQHLPPKDGDFMILPAGGTYHGEVSCIRSQTSYGRPGATDDLPEYACKEVDSLHTILNLGEETDSKWLGGCALAIAYESDVTKVKPEDFVVLSVNHECVWKRKVNFEIPEDIPACPPGGCHCTWNWIHEAVWADEGVDGLDGSAQYNLLCASTETTHTVGAPQVPVECLDDSSRCIKGAKMPMYFAQAEGYNIVTSNPPLYNDMMGFSDGAQDDILIETPAKSKRSATQEMDLIERKIRHHKRSPGRL